MQIGSAFDPISEIQQLPNRDTGLSRIAFPFGDRLRNRVVQLEQTIAHRAKRREAPETFGSAKNWPSAFRNRAAGIMFEDRATVLYHQHGSSALGFRIFCSPAQLLGWISAETDNVAGSSAEHMSTRTIPEYRRRANHPYRRKVDPNRESQAVPVSAFRAARELPTQPPLPSPAVEQPANNAYAILRR